MSDLNLAGDVGLATMPITEDGSGHQLFDDFQQAAGDFQDEEIFQGFDFLGPSEEWLTHEQRSDDLTQEDFLEGISEEQSVLLSSFSESEDPYTQHMQTLEEEMRRGSRNVKPPLRQVFSCGDLENLLVDTSSTLHKGFDGSVDSQFLLSQIEEIYQEGLQTEGGDPKAQVAGKPRQAQAPGGVSRRGVGQIPGAGAHSRSMAGRMGTKQQLANWQWKEAYFPQPSDDGSSVVSSGAVGLASSSATSVVSPSDCSSDGMQQVQLVSRQQMGKPRVHFSEPPVTSHQDLVSQSSAVGHNGEEVYYMTSTGPSPQQQQQQQMILVQSPSGGQKQILAVHPQSMQMQQQQQQQQQQQEVQMVQGGSMPVHLQPGQQMHQESGAIFANDLRQRASSDSMVVMTRGPPMHGGMQRVQVQPMQRQDRGMSMPAPPQQHPQHMPHPQDQMQHQMQGPPHGGHPQQMAQVRIQGPPPGMHQQQMQMQPSKVPQSGSPGPPPGMHQQQQLARSMGPPLTVQQAVPHLVPSPRQSQHGPPMMMYTSAPHPQHPHQHPASLPPQSSPHPHPASTHPPHHQPHQMHPAHMPAGPHTGHPAHPPPGTHMMPPGHGPPQQILVGVSQAPPQGGPQPQPMAMNRGPPAARPVGAQSAPHYRPILRHIAPAPGPGQGPPQGARPGNGGPPPMAGKPRMVYHIPGEHPGAALVPGPGARDPRHMRPITDSSHSAAAIRRVQSTGDLHSPVFLGPAVDGVDGRGRVLMRVGRYTLAQRRSRILRYKEKRHARAGTRKPKCNGRKSTAEARPRAHGRFAKWGGMGPRPVEYDEHGNIVEVEDMDDDDGDEEGDEDEEFEDPEGDDEGDPDAAPHRSPPPDKEEGEGSDNREGHDKKSEDSEGQSNAESAVGGSAALKSHPANSSDSANASSESDVAATASM